MTTLQPGARPFLLVFERGEAVRGGLGVETATKWSELFKAWGSARFGASRERREAAATSATAVATFRVPSTAASRDVTERDRIWFQGRAWDVQSICPSCDNDEIEFTAIAAKG